VRGGKQDGIGAYEARAVLICFKTAGNFRVNAHLGQDHLPQTILEGRS